MTKRREPMTFHRALTTIAARIGWDTCAAICGVCERTVRYWSDPDCETEIRLIDAQRLDRAYLERGGDHAPFHQVYALRLGIVTARAKEDDLLAMAAEAAREGGEATAAIITAAHAPSPAALRAARKEGEEAITAIKVSLAALAKAHEEGEGQ